MAVPKRKTSKARRDKRRTHWKASAPTLITCSNCSEAKLPHRVCPHCGYYKGKQVIIPKEV
ncbi:MAG: 50S ribosomal protein L32 [Candidatus Marinimicrobia bacterium]|nr:50S ribosomal protein L32 [Candidatus Neomarinimicrobiota bacterium]MCF7802467.1 50S ribosomal protein L32 [Candidatus Neomarinimicrobiota bacterium]MCF7839420.1 50S ribosomal protein L32 [Candidatus Neomarinimicrobiota bacterium]MCF7842904.1 50S ribosomal protein L32 [Lentisphaeria bacterium]MCF7902589.1 50S ribosomal protein L32 [Candidatus Neomarinimicrobiota bacterium]